MYVSTSICVEIVCNCVYGSELIFGLGFWGVSLPVVGGDWAGDSGLTGGRGDKTLNFAQWVWSLGLVGAGGWVVSVAPPTRGSERAGGGGQETSCFRGLVQHSLSGWDACHSCPTHQGQVRKALPRSARPPSSPPPQCRVGVEVRELSTLEKGPGLG